MKLIKSFFLFMAVIWSATTYAQIYGCTDPAANNYNPQADVDNGYCCYGNYLTIEASNNVQTVEFFSLQSYYAMWWPVYPDDCFPDGCVTVNAHLMDNAGGAWVNVYNNGVLVLALSDSDSVGVGGYNGFGMMVGQFVLGQVVEGCTNGYACNYNPAATCDDGSCEEGCAGCTDPSAVNFDPTATINDGSCCGDSNYLTFLIDGVPSSVDQIFFSGFGAQTFFDAGASSGCVQDGCWMAYVFGPTYDSTVVWSMVDANGIVVAQGTPFEFMNGIPININAIEGCPDPNACNYNPASTCLDYTQCSYDCQGCTNPSAGNYDPNATVDDGSCCDLYYTIVADGPMSWSAWSFTSFGYAYGYYPYQSGFCLFDGCYTFSTGTQYDQELGANPVVNWQLLDSDGNVVLTGSTETGLGVEFSTPNVLEGCMDGSACNYDPEVNCGNIALCNYDCFGCTDPLASNYNSAALVDNGTCCYNEWYTIVSEVPGTWYAGPTNWESYVYGQYPAENGFCAFDGCGYLSYYPFDQSLMVYSVSVVNSNGEVVGTLNVDMINGLDNYIYFDQNSVVGCSDFYACNYNPNANCSDYASCDYSCYGCTDPTAPNYDPNATNDNGTCCYTSWYTLDMSAPAWWSVYDNQSGAYVSGQFPVENGFCMSGGCFQFQAFSIDGTEVAYTIYDQEGVEVFTGTFGYDGEWVLTNVENEVVGCTDVYACNYDPMATCNDYNVCTYGCYGCIDPTAPNYDPTATISDGSCCYGSWFTLTSDQSVYWYVVDGNYGSSGGFYPEQTGFCSSSSCIGFYVYGLSETPANFQITDGDGNVVLTGTTILWGYYGYDISLGEEIAGCTDIDACNFNPDANCDNGTCQWYCGGCMDPTALNYSTTANYEDGTCVYEIELPNMGMSVIPDAENEQYYVLLNMMNEGNGAPYVLSNDFNQQMMMVDSTGQYMAGPYPCNQPVEVRLISMSVGLETYFDAVMEGECVQSIGVDETASANDLVIFPNPATDFFTISGLQDGMAQVDIRDISGRLVMSQQMNVSGGRLEMQNQFVAGVYQIQCTVGMTQYQGRVILQ
jgi:hypothetical protein